ncbi:hypothetical protein [Haloferax sulfurifontis]|uniref:hypothetical protein n=1 Tax=Haloferax sulfurifontis TaxID=255616 RepID=UPI001664B13A|nr:hypothetical protein [Haloferax sulfurifontis]
MDEKALLLFSINVMVFGGFLWLKSGMSGLNGYWIMVFGLVIGLAGIILPSIRHQIGQ